MITTLVGILLGLAIGAGCRWFDIPAPSPPKLVGALLVLFMTLGYLATDCVMHKVEKTAAISPAPSPAFLGAAHD